MNKKSPIVRRGERGNAALEFGLAVPLLLAFGAMAPIFGVVFEQYLRTADLANHAVRIHYNGGDLGEAAVQDEIAAAAGLSMTRTGGQAVLYLSTVVMATSGSNLNRPVISHRITIGAPSIAPSSLGSPNGVDSHGHVSDYQNSGAALATLPDGVTMAAGDRLFVAEVSSRTATIAFQGVVNIPTMGARMVLRDRM